jgi:phospholipase C
MKSAGKAVVLFILSLTLFAAVLAHAQTYSNPPFQHVIIVVQENRTPDNLFAGYEVPGYSQYVPALGAGYDLALPQPQSYESQNQPVPWCMGTCFNPLHTHADWEAQYNSGGTYSPGASNWDPESCFSGSATCNSNIIGSTQMPMPTYPQETYSSPFDDVQYFTITNNQGQPVAASPLTPYFDIAAKYGFANYFFQTNQGPSQPAHDFLFGGTSSPTVPGGPSYYFQLFSGENVNLNTSGCGTSAKASVIFPNGNTTDSDFNGGNALKTPPCFERQTMADLLDNASPQLTWRYYTNATATGDGIMGIWTAPAGIQHLCYPLSGTQCNSQYFTGANNPYGIPNVIAPSQVFFSDAFTTPGGTNLPNQGTTCDLPNVTWIIPNGAWSDHPGGATSQNYELGPDWVASIINAVGNAGCVEPSGPYAGQSPWNDTVIFVVWDDWGGFYDHVGSELPFGNGLFTNFDFGPQYTGDKQSGTQSGCLFTAVQGGNWGCGYTYGWRVPFLVVSKWTPDGYVSGACGAGTLNSCPNPGPYNVHDFGSILAFIEDNFHLPVGGINSTSDSGGGYAGTGYLFADAYYPEGQVTSGPYLPLGDFFGLYQYSENYSSYSNYCQTNACPRPFDAIQCVVPTNPPSSYSGNASNFCPGYFTGYTGPVEDPDNDVIDND